MKKSIRQLFGILVCLSPFFSMSGFGQTMNIILPDGTTNSFFLSSDSKIYFENDNLLYNENNFSIPVDQIRKITFSTSSGVGNVAEEGKNFFISPNPAKDEITLKNVPNEICSVKIYNLTGKLMFSQNLNPASTIINISSLPKGIYLVKVNNSTAKLVKL
ncbi:MAG: T9SS type A sorting domain-containing protein [Paludibacteraceae bacterium]|nr:T9SS type A sorting domain-containing protein [Paludibacteraceae bacterium]